MRALRWPVLCGLLLAATARAETPQPQLQPQAVARSRIAGRVFERGSAVPLAGAVVEVRDGEQAITDDEGRFALEVAPGDVAIVVTANGYEPLSLVEKLPPHVARTVEYRLMPRASGGTRYRSTVRGARALAHEGDHVTLRDEELLQAPGAAGDPFRVIATLPGVVAPIPLLPIYVIRGGSPGTNGFFIDGMRVPQLFHLLIADGVVHPRILDRIDFYPGAYDATFGHYASGIIDAATRPGRTDAPAHGELELRLYDASALVEARLPGGVSLLAAGRYGYPAPIIQLVQPGVDVSYWDYQLRLDWRGLTLEALGSYDSLTVNLPQLGRQPNLAAQFLVEFHRVQLRERLRRGSFELDAALVGGLDRMSIFSGQGVQKLALTARLDARWKALPWLQIAAGADVELSRFRADNFEPSQAAAAPDELGDLTANRDGVVAGTYAQATLVLDRLLGVPASITAGGRVDVYHANGTTLLGIDPRLTARIVPLERLELFAGFGLYQQPPSFPVPLPGIDTYELQLGLQRAWQGSAGVRVKLPWQLALSATGYYARFANLDDVVLDLVPSTCTSPPPESVSGLSAYVTRQVNGDAYGLELLLRRQSQSGRVTGWLAYTIGRSERVYSCGLAPSDFDQTHVLNVVVQLRLPWRVLLGVRLALSTGRPYTQLSVDLAQQTFSGTRNNMRMPTFYEIDVRFDREWIFRRWALALSVEALNITYSESIFGVTFPRDPTLMITRYDQPQFEGFRWVLPSIGLRARF